MLLALLSLALGATQPAPTSGTYAVLDIANEKGEITALSSYIGDELSLRYASDSGYPLVERGQLKKVIKEHGFQASGAVDEATISSLGKFLGAARIITGQYYQMGDDYVAMVRVLDVSTAKVLRMTKVTFPKSSSTQALAQTILEAGAPVSTQNNANTTVPPTSAAEPSSQGPLTLDRCKVSYGTLYCYGTFIAPTKGRFNVPEEQELFFLDDGIMSKFAAFSIAGTKGDFDVPPNTKVPVELVFTRTGKKFRDFHLKYTYAGKTYSIDGPRPID